MASAEAIRIAEIITCHKAGSEQLFPTERGCKTLLGIADLIDEVKTEKVEVKGKLKQDYS
jgi:hypothetical protein